MHVVLSIGMGGEGRRPVVDEAVESIEGGGDGWYMVDESLRIVLALVFAPL